MTNGDNNRLNDADETSEAKREREKRERDEAKHEEAELDEALDETFPASDPISPSRIDGPNN